VDYSGSAFVEVADNYTSGDVNGDGALTEADARPAEDPGQAERA